MKNFFRFLLIVNLCFIAQSNTTPCFAQGAGYGVARPAQRAMRLPPTSYAILSPVYLPPTSTSSVDLDIVDRGSNNIGIDPNCGGGQCAYPTNDGSYYPANNYAPNSAWGDPNAAAAPTPADPAAYSTCDPNVYGCTPSDPSAYSSCGTVDYGSSCGGVSSCSGVSVSSCSGVSISPCGGVSSCSGFDPAAAGCSGASAYSSSCPPCGTCPWSLGGL